LQYIFSKAVETNTLVKQAAEEVSLQARAWAAAPVEAEGTRPAAVNAAAKECGDGRTSGYEESMERKWESAARGQLRESGLRREFQEATSRTASGMSANTAKAAWRRDRGREQ
jgi:hypothetical protein